MKTHSWKTYVLWILMAEAVGILSGWLSQDGIRTFGETAVQPNLSPPAILFPVVWTVLYALMGISASRVYLQPLSPERSLGLNLYIIQLIFNFFWSLIFFQAKSYGFALIWLLLLWLLVFMMIISFEKTEKTAAILLIPYLIWLTFAAYLNWSVWRLNR